MLAGMNTVDLQEKNRSMRALLPIQVLTLGSKLFHKLSQLPTISVFDVSFLIASHTLQHTKPLMESLTGIDKKRCISGDTEQKKQIGIVATQRSEGTGRKMEPASGIEPPTYGLRNRCSTTELRRHKKDLPEKRYSNSQFKIIILSDNMGVNLVMWFSEHTLMPF